MLSGGKSSPLYRELVHERQLAQDVSAFALPTELAASFVVVSTARPGSDPAELEARLRRKLTAAAGAPPAAAEIERARNRFRTAYFDQLQLLEQRADLLSRFTTLFDDPGRIETELARYDTVAEDDLVRFAARRLADGGGVVLTVAPPAGAR